MNTLNGSCICGAVKYEIVGACRDIIACHCIQCRKFTGHFTAVTATLPENLKIIHAEGLRWYRAPAEESQRGFCKYCGSTLFWKPDTGDRISVYAGTIDDQSGLKLTSHIFVEEKGDYYEIEDDAEQYATDGATLTL